MKELIAVVFLSLGFQTAHADVINCGFTEPFYDLVIDTDAKTLTQTDFITEDGNPHTTVLSTNVTIKKLPSKVVSSTLEYPRYEVEADGKSVLVLELNFDGSDGMSDLTYPYSTKHGRNYGGCDSDKVKRFERE